MQKTFEFGRDAGGNWATDVSWLHKQTMQPSAAHDADFAWLCAGTLDKYFPETVNAKCIHITVSQENVSGLRQAHWHQWSVRWDDVTVALPHNATLRMRELLGNESDFWFQVLVIE